MPTTLSTIDIPNLLTRHTELATDDQLAAWHATRDCEAMVFGMLPQVVAWCRAKLRRRFLSMRDFALVEDLVSEAITTLWATIIPLVDKPMNDGSHIRNGLNFVVTRRLTCYLNNINSAGIKSKTLAKRRAFVDKGVRKVRPSMVRLPDMPTPAYTARWSGHWPWEPKSRLVDPDSTDTITGTEFEPAVGGRTTNHERAAAVAAGAQAHAKKDVLRAAQLLLHGSAHTVADSARRVGMNERTLFKRFADLRPPIERFAEDYPRPAPRDDEDPPTKLEFSWAV